MKFQANNVSNRDPCWCWGGGKGSIGDYFTVPRLVATAIFNTSLGESLIMLPSASRRDEIPPDAFGCDEVGEIA